MYCFSRMGCDYPSFVQRNRPPKLRIPPLINAIEILKKSSIPLINLPSTFVISNELARIVLAWDTSSIYAKHLSEMWLISRDVGLNCCFSHKQISLVLCCDVCKSSVVLGLCYHCPCHVLPREDGGQSSQECMCPQNFILYILPWILASVWFFFFFQTVNFKFAIDSAFENQC